MAMNQWELDGIAAALENTMDDLADVYRRTGNEDEYGGGPEFIKVVPATKISVVPEDFFQFQNAQMAGRLQDVSYYACAVPRGTAVKVGDVIDVYTMGVKITVDQVERAETWDTMVRFHGQIFDDEGWFDLNFHAGGHS